MSNLFFLLSLSLLFVACHNDEEWTTTSGFRISLSDEQLNVTTRSTPSEIGKPAADKFHLKITSHKTGETIYDAAYTNDIIPASTGTYSLTASFGDNPVLAWDTPYYKGNTDAEVKADETASVAIPCSVANSLLSVRFSNIEKFDTYYRSYGVKVKIGNTSLNIEKDNSQKSAYFQAGSKVELTFYATLQDNGQEVSMKIENSKLPTVYEAGKHTKLSLTAAIPASGTILTVDKVDIEKVTVSATIPMEWLPKPKVTGFGGSNLLEYTETADAPADAVIGYTASSPVQDVEFTLDFKDKQFTAYNKTYTLSAMTEEERRELSNIGIILPTLDGAAQEGALNLSTMTAKLLTDNGTEIENIVKCKVRANNRWSSEEGESYTIKVKKPEFTVNVQPGNCWSKEFTVDEIEVTAGNAERIKNNLVYQYSADGGITWKNCSNDNTQKFDSHPEKKDYKVRALYRKYISTETIDINLEDNKNVTNGDMEKWTSSQRYNQPYYQPWDAETQWWDSNNNQTMPKKYSTYPNYKCFPTTTYTEQGYSGKAAIIRSVAINDWNSEIMGNGSTTGILYTGSTDDSGNMTNGRPFSSRPTKLTFVYQYDSYDNERFGAYIELYNNDIQIASGSFISSHGTSVPTFTTEEIAINYSNLKLKATSIYISFYSVAKGDGAATRKVTVPIPAGSYKIYGGSVLTIDNVNLVYDK